MKFTHRSAAEFNLLARAFLTKSAIASSLLIILVGCGGSKTAEEHLADAKTLQQSGNWAGAILEYKNAVQLAPDDSESRVGLGFAHLELGDFESGLKELKRARSLGSTDVATTVAITRALILLGENDEAATELALHGDFEQYDWRYLQAMLDLRVGRYEDSQKAFAMLVEEKPSDRQAQRGLISSWLQLGNVEEAKKALDSAVENGPEDADIWTMKGELDVMDGHYEAASESYQKALMLDPDAYSARVGQVVALAGLARFEQAKDVMSGLPEAAENDLRVIYLNGIVAEGLGKTGEAILQFRTVVQQRPAHREALQKLAKLHFEAGEMTRAIEYLEQLTALYPDEQQYRKQLGAAQLAAGRLDSAFEELSALDINIEKQTDANMLALLGSAYAKQGKLSDGIDSLKRAHELAPESTAITVQLALGYLRSGERDRAKPLLQRVLQNEPENLTANVLNILTHAQHEPEKAKELLNKFIEETPSKALALNIRGFLNLSAGELDSAREDFEKAILADETFLPPYFNLARLERVAGNTDAIPVHLKRVLEIEPVNSQALLGLGSLSRLNGENEKAVTYWESARQNNPDAARPRAALARYYRENGQLPLAKQLIEEAYNISPYEPLIQYEYAQILLIEGNTTESREVISKLADRFPESPRVLDLEVAVSRLTGDEASLVTSLTKILKITPNAVRPHRMLVGSLLRDEKIEEARNVADMLLAQEDRIAAAQELHGDISYSAGELSRALGEYGKSFEQSPNTQIVLKLDKLERALNQPSTRLEDWLKDHPDDRAVRFQHAANKHAKGDVSEAKASFEQMLEASPDNPVVLNNLAWIYHEIDDDRAVRYAEKANKLNPNNAEIMDTYAWILLSDGKVEQALKLLNRAIELSPENPDIRYHYASALAEVGQKELAIEELSSVLGEQMKEFASMADAEALLQSLKSGG